MDEPFGLVFPNHSSQFDYPVAFLPFCHRIFFCLNIDSFGMMRDMKTSQPRFASMSSLYQSVRLAVQAAGQWLIFGFARLLALLPYGIQRRLGIVIGRLAKIVMPSRRKVARQNIALCFPGLSQNEQTALLNQHFDELGQMLTQTLRAFWGNTRKLEKSVQIEGLEYLRHSVRQGRGVLLVSGHFTALDMGGKLLSRQIKIAGVYRPHKQGVLERQVLKARLQYGDAMFKRDELRSIIRYLRQGGVIWYAPDQDYRRGKSVFVPFFGQPAATITATHQLARLSGCAVHFFFVKRLDKAPWYRLKVSPALENFPGPDVVEDTRRINAGLERMVQEAPAQYLWIHKRFKTRPEGMENPYQ